MRVVAKSPVPYGDCCLWRGVVVRATVRLVNILPPAQAREAVRLGRPEAARQLGLNRESLRRYETGRREPGAALLERMRQLYHLTDEELRGLLAWYAARSTRAA